MRVLLYLFFLACLFLILICMDLVRWQISKFQPVLLSLRR